MSSKEKRADLIGRLTEEEQQREQEERERRYKRQNREDGDQ